jgi:methionyl-tRNA synthetase
MAMDGLILHEAVGAAFGLIDGTNRHIAETAPWTLAKDPKNADRVTQVLFECTEAIRLAAVLLSPVMPASSREILRRVGESTDNLNLTRDGAWHGRRARGSAACALAAQGIQGPFTHRTPEPKAPLEPKAPAPVEPQAPLEPLGV